MVRYHGFERGDFRPDLHPEWYRQEATPAEEVHVRLIDHSELDPPGTEPHVEVVDEHGHFVGVDPTDEDAYNALRPALKRESSFTVGVVALELWKRTTAYNDGLARDGLAELREDPTMQELVAGWDDEAWKLPETDESTQGE